MGCLARCAEIWSVMPLHAVGVDTGDKPRKGPDEVALVLRHVVGSCKIAGVPLRGAVAAIVLCAPLRRGGCHWCLWRRDDVDPSCPRVGENGAAAALRALAASEFACARTSRLERKERAVSRARDGLPLDTPRLRTLLRSKCRRRRRWRLRRSPGRSNVIEGLGFKSLIQTHLHIIHPLKARQQPTPPAGYPKST